MLCRIHEGHLWIDKQNNMSRNVLYWPHMDVDVDGRQQVIILKQIGLYNKHVEDLPVLEPNNVVRVRKYNKWETKAYVIVQLSLTS